MDDYEDLDYYRHLLVGGCWCDILLAHITTRKTASR